MHHYKDYINGSRYQKLVSRRLVRIDQIVQWHRHGTLQCLVTIISLAFCNSSWGTDEILPGWELASGLAFSESKMAAKDGNRITKIDISS